MDRKKIETALKEQGRTKWWLANQLGIRASSLSTKLLNNRFSESQKIHIEKLLGAKKKLELSESNIRDIMYIEFGVNVIEVKNNGSKVTVTIEL